MCSEKFHTMFQNCLQLMLTLYFKFQHSASLPPLMVSIKSQQTLCKRFLCFVFLIWPLEASVYSILECLNSLNGTCLRWNYRLLPLQLASSSSFFNKACKLPDKINWLRLHIPMYILKLNSDYWEAPPSASFLAMEMFKVLLFSEFCFV